MGDLGQLLSSGVTAAAALVVALVAVFTAEGGPRRRRLKHIRETIELLGVMDARDFSPERRTGLEQELERLVDVYLQPTRQRWTRRLSVGGTVYLVAAVVFMAVDALTAAMTGGRVTQLTTYLVVGVGVGVLGLAGLGLGWVIGVLIGKAGVAGYTGARRVFRRR